MAVNDNFALDDPAFFDQFESGDFSAPAGNEFAPDDPAFFDQFESEPMPQQPTDPDQIQDAGGLVRVGQQQPPRPKPQTTREWMDELSRRPDIPNNILFSPFSIARGAERQAERVHEGLEQRLYDIGDFFNIDTAQRRERLAERRQRREEEYARTAEDFPAATFVGELVGGMGTGPAGVAGAPARLAGEIGTGALLGAAEYVPEEGTASLAGNIAFGAGSAVAGHMAAPYISAGMDKASALAAGIIRKSKGFVDGSFFNLGGGLNQKGKRALEEAAIGPEEFTAALRNPDVDLNPKQVRRKELGEEFDIRLTQGDITQRRDIQQAEKTLERSGIGKEGYEAQLHAEGKLQDITDAADRFQMKYGNLYDDRLTRGTGLQQEAMAIREQERQAVRSMYDAAEEIAGTSTPLDNESLVDHAYRLIDERTVEEPFVKTLEKKLAEFGLIGTNPQRKGRFTTVVDERGKSIEFLGDPKELNMYNSERFRQALNDINPSDPNGQRVISELKKNLDDQIDSVLKNTGASSERMNAFIEARNAHKEWARKYKGKDIIDQLTSLKKGVQDTPQVDPSMVMDKITKGKQGLGNLRKIKKLLLENPTETSEQAWRNIQAQSMADLFSAATGASTDSISGKGLNKYIESTLGNGNMREGNLKLKEILGDDFSEFQRLRETIGLATILKEGITSTSGTADVIIGTMVRMGALTSKIPGIGAAQEIGKLASEAKAARETIKGIKNPTPEQVERVRTSSEKLFDAFIGMGINRGIQTERKRSELETEQRRREARQRQQQAVQQLPYY